MSEIADSLSRAIHEHMSELLHTAMPAKIQRYVHSKRLADVKPLIKRQYADGTILDMPVIVNVPVMFPKTADFEMCYPLKNGDFVLVVFCERSIDKWLSSNGSETTPDDSRKFSLTDAVAFPGLFPFTKPTKASDESALTISYKKSSIVFKDDGTIDINSGNLTVKI